MVVELKIPQYQVSAAASSPEAAADAALKLQTDSAKNQTLRNGMAGGGGNIPAPMAVSSGAPEAGANNAQGNMSGVMKGLLDAQASSEYDGDVKGGGKKRKKRRRTRMKRGGKKSRGKSRRRKSRRRTKRKQKRRKTRRRSKKKRGGLVPIEITQKTMIEEIKNKPEIYKKVLNKLKITETQAIQLINQYATKEKLDKIINKLLLQKNLGKNMKGGERVFSERITDALICIIICNMSNNYFGTSINCGLFCGMAEILLE
jgi:hypothetical protein